MFGLKNNGIFGPKGVIKMDLYFWTKEGDNSIDLSNFWTKYEL